MTTKSLAAGPLLMPQLDSLRNASDTALAMTAAIAGKTGDLARGMTANEPLSPKQLALTTLLFSSTQPGLWREGP